MHVVMLCRVCCNTLACVLFCNMCMSCVCQNTLCSLKLLSCVCVCVCVISCEREKERKRETEIGYVICLSRVCSISRMPGVWICRACVYICACACACVYIYSFRKVGRETHTHAWCNRYVFFVQDEAQGRSVGGYNAAGLPGRALSQVTSILVFCSQSRSSTAANLVVVLQPI